MAKYFFIMASFLLAPNVWAIPDCGLDCGWDFGESERRLSLWNFIQTIAFRIQIILFSIFVIVLIIRIIKKIKNRNYRIIDIKKILKFWYIWYLIFSVIITTILMRSYWFEFDYHYDLIVLVIRLIMLLSMIFNILMAFKIKTKFVKLFFMFSYSGTALASIWWPLFACHHFDCDVTTMWSMFLFINVPFYILVSFLTWLFLKIKSEKVKNIWFNILSVILIGMIGLWFFVWFYASQINNWRMAL